MQQRNASSSPACSAVCSRSNPSRATARPSALIKDFVARQPSSPYLLVQTVLVQEQALKAAQERIAELEAKAAAPRRPRPGFLGSAPKIGPWGASADCAWQPAPSAACPVDTLARCRRGGAAPAAAAASCAPP